MLGIVIRACGRWAQFRKPETNNTPLTHDFITKTATVGLIGAVLGIERAEMRSLFPKLCEDLLYGVQVRGAVKKESWAFTLRNVHKQNDPAEKAPRQMEFIRDPDYTVALAIANDRSISVFDQFAESIVKSEARFTPVFGLQNCPAELYLIDQTEFTQEAGEYSTKGFALRSHRLRSKLEVGVRVGFDRVPTHQNADWWNAPDAYRDVIYPSASADLLLEGEHFVSSTGDSWCLI